MSEHASWGELLRAPGLALLVIYCSGVWLFAADGLMVATLMPVLVPEIGGAELIGWAGALFQALAIVSGALSVFLVRKWRISSAFISNCTGFMLGCLISSLAQDMVQFQAGRLVQALCGGALVSLAHIGVTQIMPSRLRVRAFALISIIWGFAAFSAPLVGAYFAEFVGWRGAFYFAAGLAAIVGISAYFAYRAQAGNADESATSSEPFPIVRLAYLTAGVSLIATASLVSNWLLPLILIVFGIALSALFAVRDASAGKYALMPKGAFDPRTAIGAVHYFVFFAGAATIAMGVFGPLLLAAAFDLSPLVIGYLLFLAAAGWTLLAALLSGVRPQDEPRIIFAGAIVIVLSSPLIAIGFATSNLWLVGLGLFADGAGFGSCWGLILRRTTQHPDQRENERISSAINNVQRAGLAFGAAFLSVLVNALGYEQILGVEHARQMGFWMMAASTLIGLPALIAAFRFSRVPEAEIHSAKTPDKPSWMGQEISE